MDNQTDLLININPELNSEISVDSLNKSSILVRDLLQNFAHKADFIEQMEVAFTPNFDAKLLRKDWFERRAVFPEIEIVSAITINGSNGAFAQENNKIYLAAEFLLANQSNLETIATVFLEEYGHFIDSQFNLADSPGDEGDIFSALVQGRELGEQRLAELRNEDDLGYAVINNQNLTIEQSSSNLINGLGGDAGFGENFLEANDDDSSDLIDITPVFEDGLNFFGTTYQGFYINNNGNITFNNPQDIFTPFAITDDTGIPIIAPFFADVDTRAGSINPSSDGNSTGSNLVYWDLDPQGEQITITWDDVGQYFEGIIPNAFQLILRDLGAQNFQIEFRYEEIQWTVGDASDDQFARAGYSAADGENFQEIPQSGNNEQMLELERASNVNDPGRFIFSVINGIPVVGTTVNGLSLTKIHRFYEFEKGFHLYTSDENEIRVVIERSGAGELNYRYESEKFTVLTDDKDAITGEAIAGVKPVYRFFNTETGAHLYTMDDNEKGYIQDNLTNYNFEGIKYYAFEAAPEDRETVPVYRMLNGQSGAHLFSIDQNEINHIRDNLPHFSTEGNSGIAFHVFDLNAF